MVKGHTLFIRKNIGFGGCEYQLLDWIKKIDYAKTDVTLLTTHDVFTPEIRRLSLSVEVEEVGDFFRPSLSNILRWVNILRKRNPDRVVLMEGTFYDIPLFLVILARLISAKRVCITEHTVAPEPPLKSSKKHFGIIPGLGIWWYRKVLPLSLRRKFAHAVFATSESVRRRLMEWGYDGEKIKIIRHGVNTKRFAPSKGHYLEMRDRYEIPESATVIVTTARLSWEKRIDRLLNAYASFADRFEDVWLLIAGGGPLRSELMEMAGGRKRVKFLGEVGRDEVSSILKGCDIYAQPSDSEGFGIALLEAMATGLICVAIKGSGPDDIIRDGIDGFLADPTEEDFSARLNDIIQLESSERARISNSARKRVEEKFELRLAVNHALTSLGIPSKT